MAGPEVAIYQEHLGTQIDGDALVPVLKAVKLADAVKKVRQLFLESGVVAVVLNVLKHAGEFVDFQQTQCPASALLHGEAVGIDGVFNAEVAVSHHSRSLRRFITSLASSKRSASSMLFSPMKRSNSLGASGVT